MFEKFRERFGEVEIPKSNASILFNNGIWKLKIKNVGEAVLPTIFGRNLLLATRLKVGYMAKLKRLGLPDNPQVYRRRMTSFTEKQYWKVDCYAFVARCLGYQLPLKFIKTPGYTANFNYFAGADFTKYTPDSLRLRLVDEVESIQVLQLKNKHGQRTHICFSVRVGDDIYIIEEPGYGNLKVHTLEEAFQDWTVDYDDNSEYGDNVYFESYSVTSSRPDLQDYYKKFHSTY